MPPRKRKRLSVHAVCRARASDAARKREERSATASQEAGDTSSGGVTATSGSDDADPPQSLRGRGGVRVLGRARVIGGERVNAPHVPAIKRPHAHAPVLRVGVAVRAVAVALASLVVGHGAHVEAFRGSLDNAAHQAGLLAYASALRRRRTR